MATASIIVGVATLSAFLSAAFLTPAITQNVHQFIVVSRLYPDSSLGHNISAALMRNGIAVAKPLSRIILKNKHAKIFFSEAVTLLSQKGFVSDIVNVCSLCCVATSLLFILGSMVGSSWLMGLVFVLGAVIIGVSWINYLKELRIEKIREAVPDALRSMSVCTHVGLSLQQTFNQVASEVTGPLKSLFLRAAHGFEAGKTTHEILEEFHTNSSITELAFVAVALDVQHKAGGSLRRVLDAARDSIESELELKRSLKVQTAQAKLSARIVSIMPFILVALFSFLSPGFLEPFFTSPQGFALLGVAILMQGSGIMLVRRLLKAGLD